MEPISSLVIKRATNLPPNEVCEEVLKIGMEGEVVWEHYDAGPSTEAVYGDSDHESLLWVNKDYKDTLLLHLIADHFTDRDKFYEWLRSKAIPAQGWLGKSSISYACRFFSLSTTFRASARRSTAEFSSLRMRAAFKSAKCPCNASISESTA